MKQHITSLVLIPASPSLVYCNTRSTDVHKKNKQINTDKQHRTNTGPVAGPGIAPGRRIHFGRHDCVVQGESSLGLGPDEVCRHRPCAWDRPEICDGESLRGAMKRKEGVLSVCLLVTSLFLLSCLGWGRDCPVSTATSHGVATSPVIMKHLVFLLSMLLLMGI